MKKLKPGMTLTRRYDGARVRITEVCDYVGIKIPLARMTPISGDLPTFDRWRSFDQIARYYERDDE